ncbi:MAG: hypothetical protein QG587_913, partial [Chloroflexota bacterium]|nr:hypothetical protein [Chloroflexota bacterium]
GLPLVRLERGRHSLEDLFRDGEPEDGLPAPQVPEVRA